MQIALDVSMPHAQWERTASILSLAFGAVTAALLQLRILPSRPIELVEVTLRRWAGQPWFCRILIPAISIAINSCVAWHNGVPTPKIHDEFSYLLAADTFAHGRLTNPTPPFFEHFETPQELMRPTRMSKYPPGQGIALMVGQVIFGQPIVGVWISTALACLATYWMLLAFVQPAWALVGGLTAALSPALVDWSQNYWGGSVAVLAGAILMGAWGRLMIQPTTLVSLWQGIGLVILAGSRPFEGMMLVVPLLLILLLRQRQSLSRTMLPGALIAAAGLLWAVHYNFQVTGHMFRLPYMEYASQYSVFPIFWFDGTRPLPLYRNPSQLWVHAALDKYDYGKLRNLATLVPILLARCWQFVMGNLKLDVLLPCMAAALCRLNDRRVCWVLAALSSVLLGILAETVALPHYSAPATAGLLLLVILGWDRIAKWTGPTWFSGRTLARAVGIGFIAGAILSSSQGVSRDSRIVDQQTLVGLETRLHSGRHLIFVQYLPGYQLGNEFVYNQADLASSRIIWVHYMGTENDLPVAKQFLDRHVWLLTAAGTLQLKPYLVDNGRRSNF